MTRCKALTKSNKRCKRSVSPDRKLCFQHKSKSHSRVQKKSHSRVQKKSPQKKSHSRVQKKSPQKKSHSRVQKKSPQKKSVSKINKKSPVKNFSKKFEERFVNIWLKKLEDPFNNGDRHGSSDEAYNFVEYLEKKKGLRHPLTWWLEASDSQIVLELKKNRTTYYEKIKIPGSDDFAYSLRG